MATEAEFADRCDADWDAEFDELITTVSFYRAGVLIAAGVDAINCGMMKQRSGYIVPRSRVWRLRARHLPTVAEVREDDVIVDAAGNHWICSDQVSHIVRETTWRAVTIKKIT